MDYISSPEFHAIYDRFTDKFSLKGDFTTEDIKKSLYKAKRKCEELRSKAKVAKHRLKLKRESIQLQNLINYGFAERVIQEARKNPSGIVAMTLKYGKTEAKARILARRKTKIRVRAEKRYPPYPR